MTHMPLVARVSIVAVINEIPAKILELVELHTNIGRKKSIVGFRYLLIEIGEDTSTSIWVTGVRKQEKAFGKKNKLEIQNVMTDYW